MAHTFNWKSFIKIINNNGIVLVIGKDLSMLRFPKNTFSQSDMASLYLESGTIEGDFLNINLYDYLAIKLWDDHGYEKQLPAYTLNKVVLQLQKMNVGENEINREIKTYVSELTNDQIYLNPFQKLAKIPGFDTILTTNLDNFMERAFEAEEMAINDSINYSIPQPSVDQNNRPDSALVSIHNLMGNINGINFSLTEEQSLEYLYKLQSGKDRVANDLFDSIKDRAILLLGCSFPDWFMRFFIRIISKERFKNGVKTKYVACDRTLQDIELSYFLEHNAAKIIRIGAAAGPDGDDTILYNTSIDFIDEMYNEWLKHTETTRNQTLYKERLFLSYSWDDKAVVERLKNEFEKNGIRVFFDDDKLKTGDRYHEVIKKYIKECDYFLPIISQNAIGNKDRYVYDEEWRRAIYIDENKDESFIRPYIIDDTNPTDDRIPRQIRDINIEKVDEKDQFAATVRKFIRENNLTSLSV